MDTLRRFVGQHDAFDLTMLGIELLVLAVIGVEAIVHLWHWLKIKRHKKRVRPYYSDGLELQSEYQKRFRHDPTGTDQTPVVDWMQKVSLWIDATGEQLKKYSPDAVAAFMRDSGGLIRSYGNTNSPQASYMRLEVCMNNLHEIIEQADFYF
jgi:hypothetical protein